MQNTNQLLPCAGVERSTSNYIHLFQSFAIAMMRRLVLLAIVIIAWPGVSTTKAASPGCAKINQVRLSPSALERMDTLLAMKPGRAAKDVAATGSMQPVFDENYIVIVEEKPFEDLSNGDIVIFRGDWIDGRPVAHRLIQRNLSRRGWLTKGDHCRGADPQWLTKEKYKGSVVIAAVHKTTGQVKELTLARKSE